MGLSPAKTAEWIADLFQLEKLGGPRHIVLDRGPDGGKRALMQPTQIVSVDVRKKLVVPPLQ